MKVVGFTFIRNALTYDYPVLESIQSLLPLCDEMVVGSIAPFALSSAGNGSTRGKISVSRHCDDPVVLIQPAANLGVYIASTVGDADHE